ncbi:hypothetical protein niasHT_006171 [Heterodera trifolii]|uniref:Complex 1 LYR protein domain-containing protein n=1 Tax=Heterodera trifolii TaxID=157864 RepID=A0ABD2M2B9_9BILA
MPRSTLTGSLHPSNRGAFAWSENGIIAFGCHSVLAFFDVRRLEVFQTVDLHSTSINLICWKPSSNELLLRCASSDIGGNIVVLEGRQCAMFRNSNTPVSDLQWLCWPDVSRDFLVSLHSNNLLIVWDVGKRERLWEHRFGTSVFKLSIVAHRTKVLSIYKHLFRRFCAEFELSDPDYLSQRIRDEFRENKELSNKQADHKLKKLEQIVKMKLVI